MLRCWVKNRVGFMRKMVPNLMRTLFVLIALYPAGVILTAFIGYRFELISVLLFAISISVLSVFVLVLDIVYKNTIDDKVDKALSAIITPLSLLDVVFYFYKDSQILVVVSTLITACCCCYFTIKYGKPLTLKVFTLVSSALMILPIGLLCFLFVLLGDMSKNTVVETEESPSGKYYAQVIDNDQGALGGATIVDVYKKRGINILLFKIQKKPERVYLGEWGEYEDMEIYWKDDKCLVINSDEYDIK